MKLKGFALKDEDGHVLVMLTDHYYLENILDRAKLCDNKWQTKMGRMPVESTIDENKFELEIILSPDAGGAHE